MRRKIRFLRRLIRLIITSLTVFCLAIVPLAASEHEIYLAPIKASDIPKGELAQFIVNNMAPKLNTINFTNMQFILFRYKYSGFIYLGMTENNSHGDTMSHVLTRNGASYQISGINVYIFDNLGNFNSDGYIYSDSSWNITDGMYEVIAMRGYAFEEMKTAVDPTTGSSDQKYCVTWKESPISNGGANYTCTSWTVNTNKYNENNHVTQRVYSYYFRDYGPIMGALNPNSGITSGLSDVNNSVNEVNDSVNKVDDSVNKVNDSVNNMNDTIKDDSVNTDTGGNFFNGFQSNSHGLTSIVVAPLELIKSLNNQSCTDIPLPLPYIGKSLALPCMGTIYNQMFPQFLVLWQTITTGFISYYVLVRLFGTVKKIKDPNNDDIEVVDL